MERTYLRISCSPITFASSMQITIDATECALYIDFQTAVQSLLFSRFFDDIRASRMIVSNNASIVFAEKLC